MDDADKPYQTPGPSAYLSHEDIERKQETTIGDLFKDIPGVTSIDDNNGPNFDMNIRGLAIGRVPVGIDGASASVTSYRGYGSSGTSNYVVAGAINGHSVDGIDQQKWLRETTEHLALISRSCTGGCATITVTG